MRAPRRPPTFALLVMSGPAQGMKIPLNHTFLLGRDGSSRVPLHDERVSRHHAMVEVTQSGSTIRDLGSKNGTFVNGLEIRDPHLLRPDDRVRVGQTLMSVVEVEDNSYTEWEERRDTHAGDVVAEVAAAQQAGEEVSPVPPSGLINRRALRAATRAATAISLLCAQGEPLAAILARIKDELQAEDAALFLVTNPTEPVCHLTEMVFWKDIEPDLLNYLGGSTFTATAVPGPITAGRAAPCCFLLFFLRMRDQRPVVFVLKRSIPPFGSDDVHLAEALSECLRIVPLEDYFRPDAIPHSDEFAQTVIGSSQSISQTRTQALSFAATNATVLIVGESGTGKELFARAIAKASDRRHGPYVVVNSAALQPELIESELFGHEQGAFTGATQRTSGKLELASGGTLFLDEIGELPLDLQAKLLRVLEGKPFYRLGGGRLIHTDIRFLCATNRDLEQMVKRREFRGDLYHRINILRLVVPPLRERVEDIPELVEYFLREIAQDMPGRPRLSMSPKALRRLLSHDWPGNVRELRNTLQRMAVFAKGPILDEEHVPENIGHEDSSTTMKLPRLQVLTEMIEREEISRALVEVGGQKLAAAKLLGISRPTLDKKIKQYGLERLLKKQE